MPDFDTNHAEYARQVCEMAQERVRKCRSMDSAARLQRMASQVSSCPALTDAGSPTRCGQWFCPACHSTFFRKKSDRARADTERVLADHRADAWLATYEGYSIESGAVPHEIVEGFAEFSAALSRAYSEALEGRVLGQLLGVSFTPRGRVHGHGVIVGHRSGARSLKRWCRASGAPVEVTYFKPMQSFGAPGYAVRARLEMPKEEGMYPDPQITALVMATAAEYPGAIRCSKRYGCYHPRWKGPAGAKKRRARRLKKLRARRRGAVT